MKLIGLLVLLGLVSLVEGEVVKSFATSCPQFFLNKIPPTVLTDSTTPHRYQQICQKYKNVYRFATLYDTHNRIPVYSAYLFKEHKHVERRNTWMIEPQLDDLSGMTAESTAFGIKQALNEDYLGSGYDRGHVYPNGYNHDQAQAESTFTLTNIAPQKNADNLRWFDTVEEPLLRKMLEECDLENNQTAFLVTGVIPGETFINRTVGDDVEQNRVNIPSFYWSTFSCMKKNQSQSKNQNQNQNQRSCVSRGYLLELTGDGLAEAMFYDDVEDLNVELTLLYHTQFQVFGEKASSTKLPCTIM